MFGNNQQKPVSIPLNRLKPQTCKSCGSNNFKMLYRLSILPALLSPTSKPELIAMPLYVCEICQKEYTMPEKNEDAAN